MPNQQLLDYIDFKIKSGTPNDEIKKLLLESGWKQEDIDAGFVYLSNQNQNKNNTEFVRKSPNAGTGILVFIILFLLLAVGAFAAYKYYYLPSKNIVNNNVLNQSNSTTSATTVATSSTNEIVATTSSTCNNYDCLIAAASQCQPITAIIDFKTTNPIFPFIKISGKAKTIIKQGGSLAKCEFISSFVGLEATSSQTEKDKLLAQGATLADQSDIDFALQEYKKSFKNMDPVENVCQSSTSATLQYFKDLKNEKIKHVDITQDPTTDTGTASSTIIYTTSLGQKITCVNTATTLNQNINETLIFLTTATK